MNLDHTHDADARSWIASAASHPDRPLQNLPLARFAGSRGTRVCTAIGDCIVDLTGLHGEAGLAPAVRAALAPLASGELTALMAGGDAAAVELRHALFELLGERADATQRAAVERHLEPYAEPTLLPCRPPDFSDFYSSIHHAVNIGSLVRPDNPLLPNYRWLPVGYHGRTSTVLPSGQDFERPSGQLAGPANVPELAPARRLDYEAELGFWTGRANRLGEPIAIADAQSHVFGVSLLNDWSARDIQFWEYAPLGPFLGKSFATTLGNWIVTRQALAPFWTAAPWADDAEHRLLPHLDGHAERRGGALGITVEVSLQSARMRAEGMPPHRVSRSDYRTAFWTVGQLVAHQASNGALIETGSLIGSGTLSGPEADSRACLMEMTRGGAESIGLPSGERRTFLEDGDEVALTGWCERAGFARIGLGRCAARVLPARALAGSGTA